MSKRPVRDTLEKGTSRIPKGPLGVIGNGNLAGGIGYFTVSTINGLIPIDGVDVGFNVESHSVERENGKETHTFHINSANRDIAKFTAKFKSNPSNLDFLVRDVNVQDVEKVRERRWFTTWEVTVVATTVDPEQKLQEMV